MYVDPRKFDKVVERYLCFNYQNPPEVDGIKGNLLI